MVKTIMIRIMINDDDDGDRTLMSGGCNWCSNHEKSQNMSRWRSDLTGGKPRKSSRRTCKAAARAMSGNILNGWLNPRLRREGGLGTRPKHVQEDIRHCWWQLGLALSHHALRRRIIPAHTCAMDARSARACNPWVLFLAIWFVSAWQRMKRQFLSLCPSLSLRQHFENASRYMEVKGGNSKGSWVC